MTGALAAVRTRSGLEVEVHDELEHELTFAFSGLRETRTELYRDREADPGRTRAVFTMARDEPVFFPIWLRYYSRFFAPEDIYVLDHQTSDGSLDEGGFNRTTVRSPSWKHSWRLDEVEAKQRELLDRYEVVLFTDVDEIVAPLPTFGDLGKYINRFEEPFVNCLGYEVIHLADREPRLRVDEPILSQRRFWFANGGYNKPVLSRTPLRWQPGFHNRADGEFHFDPDLYLIHLHRVDFELCLERHRRWRGRAIDAEDAERGLGWHNQITDESEFERWFYTDTSFAEHELRIEPIPEIWRGVV